MAYRAHLLWILYCEEQERKIKEQPEMRIKTYIVSALSVPVIWALVTLAFLFE